MQHWLYLSFPCLSIDMRFRNTLQQNTPVAVYRPEENAVIQVNQAAQQMGIRPGMGMAEAASLSAELTIFRFDEKKQCRYLKLLANRLYQVASDIVLDQSSALAVRMDNLRALYESTDEILHIVLSSLSGLTSEIHYADGWNIESAKILARVRLNRCLISQQAIYNAIKACPLSAADLPVKTVQQLSRIGVKTLERVFALPFSELAKRLDNHSLNAIKKIREQNVVSPVVYHPDATFSHRLDTPFDLETTQHCRQVICALLDELEVFLRVRNLLTTEIALTLSFRESAALTHTVQSASAIGRTSHWLTLTDTWLECFELPEPVTAIMLTCKNLEPDSGGETDLFNNRHSYFMQAQLISRLKTRLGEYAVRQPKPHNDHRFDPLVSINSTGADSLITDDCPLFTLHSPVTLQDSSKVIFGPHRIQTGWWETQSTDRDYFIAVTEQGRFLQVYREEDTHWFVAGVYC